MRYPPGPTPTLPLVYLLSGPRARSLVCAGPTKFPWQSSSHSPPYHCLRVEIGPSCGRNESLQGSVRLDGEAELAASLLAQLLLLLVLLALLLALRHGPCIPEALCLVDLALPFVSLACAFGIGRGRRRGWRGRQRRGGCRWRRVRRRRGRGRRRRARATAAAARARLHLVARTPRDKI